MNIPLENPRYCAFCLEEDPIPYFRYYWHLGFITSCSIHNCLLFDCCPHCHVPIHYWETDWDQPLILCPNCHQSLTTNIKFHYRHERPEENLFQEQLLEVYNSGTFQNRKIDRSFFFQQLWKIATTESRDPTIKEIDAKNCELSVERIYKALFLAFRVVQTDFERIKRPYICPKDGAKFSTEEALKNHQLSNTCKILDSLELSKELEIERSRYEIIEPLLGMAHRTGADVEHKAKEVGKSQGTLYRWIDQYEKGGVIALAPKYKNTGRRSRILPEIKENMEVAFMKLLLEQNPNITKGWREFKDQCIQAGYSLPKIPKRAWFYMQFRAFQEEKSHEEQK